MSASGMWLLLSLLNWFAWCVVLLTSFQVLCRPAVRPTTGEPGTIRLQLQVSCLIEITNTIFAKFCWNKDIVTAKWLIHQFNILPCNHEFFWCVLNTWFVFMFNLCCCWVEAKSVPISEYSLLSVPIICCMNSSILPILGCLERMLNCIPLHFFWLNSCSQWRWSIRECLFVLEFSVTTEGLLV